MRGASVGERCQRRPRGKLTTLYGEAKAVTGHWIDESCGIAGEEQARYTARCRFDGERPSRPEDEAHFKKGLSQRPLHYEGNLPAR